jgi:hypothetical protein
VTLRGFVNVEGQFAIQPAFYTAERFINGLSLVTTKDSIGYINRSGEYVWRGLYVDYGVLV